MSIVWLKAVIEEKEEFEVGIVRRDRGSRRFAAADNWLVELFVGGWRKTRR